MLNTNKKQLKKNEENIKREESVPVEPPMYPSMRKLPPHTPPINHVYQLASENFKL